MSLDVHRTGPDEWSVTEDGITVGAGRMILRPDGRRFIGHRQIPDRALAALLTEVAVTVDGPVHLHLDGERTDRLRIAAECGFEPTLETATFSVPFAGALDRLQPMERPTRIDIVGADRVEPDALFALDNALRSRVLGDDGWTGNREWFDDELAGDEFDPSGYRVARDPVTDALVGLCRIWRNPDGPTLGLLAVTTDHSSGVIALALLCSALRGAATWGHEAFDTHTARPALQRRLLACGATRSGVFIRMSRSPD